jgi:DNA segregation ATPase FtsK/SpoIIIE, S-DNA-T family
MPTPQTLSIAPDQMQVIAKIATKLAELGLQAEFQPPVVLGPVISIYHFSPKGSTKVSALESLASDVAVTLGVQDVLIKRMPGKTSVGFFIPNEVRKAIDFKDVIKSLWPVKDGFTIPLMLGMDHTGGIVIDDLSDLPHLLIAGSTGSGKSSLLASICGSIVYSCSPQKVQFILSDTKGVEFGYFLGTPHLLFEPANSVYRTLEQLEWAVTETANRLKIIGAAGQRNIGDYNKVAAKPLSRIVFVIDELADLLLNRSKDEEKQSLSKVAEGYISTIVGRSRAAGIHLIAATQQASVRVVAGYIKANFPARLSFRLPSGSDSRTILNTEGAEHLLSPGDALYISPLRPGLTRVHTPYARIADIQAAVEAACLKEQQ